MTKLPTLNRRSFLIDCASASVSAALLAGGLAFPLPAHAAQDPAAVIRGLMDEAFTVLRDAALKRDPKKRLARLRQIADRAFDWETMAKSSLGPHWRKLDEAQRKEFKELFEELLAKQYQEDLDRFQGSEKVDIRGTQAKGDLRVVQTVLVTASKQRVPIDYTMHASGETWQVEDFSVEGVSLVNHYRKSFSQFLVNRDVAALLEVLRRKLGKS